MADLKLLRTPKIVFNEGRESVAFPMPTPGFLFRTATKESEPEALSNLMAFPATISMNNNLYFIWNLHITRNFPRLLQSIISKNSFWERIKKGSFETAIIGNGWLQQWGRQKVIITWIWSNSFALLILGRTGIISSIKRYNHPVEACREYFWRLLMELFQEENSAV